jgi:hypothetical protein
LQALGLLALRSYNRLGVGQGGEGLVALGRQQQPLKVTPKAFALGASPKEVVEAGSGDSERAYTLATKAFREELERVPISTQAITIRSLRSSGVPLHIRPYPFPFELQSAT